MKIAGSDFSRIEQIAGRIFIVIISVVATLFIAEYGYRLFRKPILVWINILEAYHHPKPYVMFTKKPDGVNFGPLGYIGPMPSLIKPPGEKRIFVTGGSSVEFGEPSWVKILGDRFKENGLEHVKVYNFGVASSVPRQDLVRILIDIAGYSPDLIVSYQGVNGTIVTNGEPRINYPLRFMLQETNPIFTETADQIDWFSMMLLGSQIARDLFYPFINARLSPGIGEMYQERRKREDLLAQAHVHNWRLANVVSRGLGANFVAFFQPTSYFKKHLAGEGEIKANNNEWTEVARRMRGLVNREVEKFPGQFEFHDLSSLFEHDKREVFRDNCHYKYQWVQEEIASHMFPILRAVLDRPVKNEPSNLQGIYPEEIFLLPNQVLPDRT